MKKQFSIKKQLTIISYKKKIEFFTYGFILNNTIKVFNQSNNIYFTKLILKNVYMKSIEKQVNFNFPLNFYFFQNFQEAKIFFYKFFQHINFLKLNYKIVTKQKLDNNFFLKSYEKLFYLNYFYFFN